MLKLFVRDGCAFCAMVLRAVEEYQIPVELCNARNEQCEAEMMEKGGKHQYPFLIDTDHDIQLYDSSVIVSYLVEHYGDVPTEEITFSKDE